MKYKRTNKGKFTSFKSKLKTFFNRLVILSVLAVTGIGIYAYASYSTAQADGTELDSLRAEVAKHQAESQNKNTGVIKTIEKVCEEEGFDSELAIKISACESYLDTYFVNVNKNGSIDRGIFAFNSRYYKNVPNECAFNVSCATKAFISEAKNGHLKNWLCYKLIR